MKKKLNKKKIYQLITILIIIGGLYWIYLGWTTLDYHERSGGCDNLDSDVERLIKRHPKDEACSVLRNGFGIEKGFGYNGIGISDEKPALEKEMANEFSLLSSTDKLMSYGKHRVYVTYFLFESGGYDEHMAFTSSVTASYYLMVDEKYISGSSDIYCLDRHYQDISYIPSMYMEKMQKDIQKQLDENTNIKELFYD